MTKIEIQKTLYEQKPRATFLYMRKGIVYYQCTINLVEYETRKVIFEIPVDDMGDADFLAIMDAKLLGRWIVV